MTQPVVPALSLADAEREIAASIFSRTPEQDHDAKLRRVRTALAALGDPHRDYRVVHVTGTNGKTSTSRMVESLLRAAGHRTGLFTSPHLTTMRERIQVAGQPITADALMGLWAEVAPVIRQVDAESLAIGGPQMSFFEVLTVLGLTAYSRAGVDVAVIEVGIGGARDATNVVTGEVAVLTPMAEDHERYLTGGITGIAREKSGIVKPGATVVMAAQRPEADAVVRAAARVAGARVLDEGTALAVRSREVAPGGQILTLATPAHLYTDVFVPLHGDFQAQNALCALAAAEAVVGSPLPAEAVERGFAASSSPGRLEVVATTPTVLVDAAHNPHGVLALADALADTFRFDHVVAVVAVLADKDADGIIAGLAPLVDRMVVTQSASERALPAAELAVVAVEALGRDNVTVIPDVDDALRAAIAVARSFEDGESGVLVAGSITLVGEARRLLGADVAPAPASVTPAIVAARETIA